MINKIGSNTTAERKFVLRPLDLGQDNGDGCCEFKKIITHFCIKTIFSEGLVYTEQKPYNN